MITKNQIIEIIYTGDSYNRIVTKYMPNSSTEERCEFKHTIILQLLNNEKNEEYLIKAYTNDELIYLYARVVDTQIKKPTSPWNLKYKMKNNDYDYLVNDKNENLEIEEDFTEIESIIQTKLKLIDEAIKYNLKLNPRLLPEFDMFRKYYMDKMTLREIGAKYNTAHSNISKYINRAKDLIKIYINFKQIL